MQLDDSHAGYLHVTAFVGAQGPFLSVLCKQGFSIDPQTHHLIAQGLVKLQPDLQYCQAPNRIARSVKAGRDLWPDKEKIDLVLRMDAVAPGHRPVQHQRVDVAFEEQQASALVFGDRHAYTLRGQLHFSDPEPFCKLPIDDFHAYGGIDPTWMPQTPEDAPRVMGMPVPELFPGANPFNPAGLGYWIQRSNFVDGLMLPNVERLGDLLTPERFFVGEPSRWPLAPRPICWGVQSLWSYPRCLYTNRRPYHMPDEGQADVMAALEPFQAGISPQGQAGQVTLGPKLMQQGAQELALSMRDGPLSLVVKGCLPTGPVRLEIPDKAPPVAIYRDGSSQELRHKRLGVHVDLRSMRLELTWASQCALDVVPRQPGGLAELKTQYLVSYEGQALSARCWPGDRAFLHL